jgi:IS5 family transposase
MKPQSFTTVKGFEKAHRTTRKEVFLSRMESLVPWGAFCALIEPHDPKAGNGVRGAGGRRRRFMSLQPRTVFMQPRGAFMQLRLLQKAL